MRSLYLATVGDGGGRRLGVGAPLWLRCACRREHQIVYLVLPTTGRLLPRAAMLHACAHCANIHYLIPVYTSYDLSISIYSIMYHIAAPPKIRLKGIVKEAGKGRPDASCLRHFSPVGHSVARPLRRITAHKHPTGRVPKTSPEPWRRGHATDR